MTFKALASNLRPRPRLCFCPSLVITITLDVILATDNPEIPTMSATLKDGKYCCDGRLLAIFLNLSLSVVSDGKNYQTWI